MAGIRGIRGDLSFEVKASQKPFEIRGWGVIRGLEGLKVGLEVLWKSLRGVMRVLRGESGQKVRFLIAGFVIMIQNLIFEPKW